MAKMINMATMGHQLIGGSWPVPSQREQVPYPYPQLSLGPPLVVPVPQHLVQTLFSISVDNAPSIRCRRVARCAYVLRFRH